MDALQPATDAELVEDVMYSLKLLWGLPTNTTERTPFRVPCTNPCSIMRDQLPQLKAQTYKVGEKTDGVRFYLLASFYWDSRKGDDGEEEEYAVLVDRAGHMFRVDMSGPGDLFAGTLLDGELCDHGGSLTYVVFDAVACNGYSVRNQPHSVRLETAQSVMASMTTSQLTLQVKAWHPLAQAVDVWMNAQGHCDGLILLPEHSPLEHGTQKDLFKWKPGHSHTVDLVYNGKHLYAWGEGNRLDLVVELHDCAFQPDAASVPVNKVCEFALMQVDGVDSWIAKVVKIRDDKPHPNSLRVAELTIQNIRENILVSELVE